MRATSAGVISTFTLIIWFAVAPIASADTVQLRPDHPQRYTVAKGDTLWDISARFLKSPWHWPKVWKMNDQIKNPHLIYPGDVVVLRFVNGKPELTVLRSDKLEPTFTPPPSSGAPNFDGRTVKLSPKVYAESLDKAIPTIAPGMILPFLSQPLVVSPEELDRAGYITVGLDSRIALGDGSEFYARGMKDDGSDIFQIFRQGKPLKHPETGELLAYEALYLGDARRLTGGDPAKFVVTSVKQEIVPTDRLLSAPKRASLPYYFPHQPEKPVNGRVLSAHNAVAEVGPFTVVSLSVGRREGMEDGHVLQVMRHVGDAIDPVTGATYRLPDEESGMLLVFRTFEKISYGLVMTATRPVHILDAVTTP